MTYPALPLSPRYPKPTVPEPDEDTILTWLRSDLLDSDSDLETTDGCIAFESDAVCDHGHPSWLRALGLI